MTNWRFMALTIRWLMALHVTTQVSGKRRTLGRSRLAEQTSDISLSCRQYGPVKFKGTFAQGDVVFSERRSLIFKKMQIVRGCDTRRNILVYMTYSDKLIEGSPKNSTSTVPISLGEPGITKRKNVQISYAKSLRGQLRELDRRAPKIFGERCSDALERPALKRLRSGTGTNFEQALRHTAGGGQSWNETGLQGVVDIHFAKERPRLRPQCIVDLCSPTPVLAVDEPGGDETPNLTVPALSAKIGSPSIALRKALAPIPSQHGHQYRS